MVDKRVVAIVPDACTLIYASVENDYGSIDPRFTASSRELLDFARRFNVGVTTEKMAEITVKTCIAGELSESEKRNLSSNISSLKHVNFPPYDIQKNMAAIDGVYERAAINYSKKVQEIYETKDELRVSRRRGILSRNKLKKWARKVSDRINSPPYDLLRRKLFEDPPDWNDRYLLSLGINLKSEFEHVFIATEDTHMCPIHTCPEIGYVIHDEIQQLGIKCYKPPKAQKEVAAILERAGVIKPEALPDKLNKAP